MSSIEHFEDNDPRGDIVVESQEGDLESSDPEVEFDEDSYFISDNQVDWSEYSEPDKPDILNFKVDPPKSFKDMEVTVSHNDFYLKGLKPNNFFADSILAVSEMHFEKPLLQITDKDGELNEKADEMMIKHGHVEGGHGLAQMMARPVQLTCSMCDMNQISCCSGCTGLCAFCKESNSNRSLNTASLFYKTETLLLIYKGKKVAVNSDTRVMAYDSETDTVVSLPIRNAFRLKLPIFKKHLERLVEHDSLAVRLLSD